MEPTSYTFKENARHALQDKQLQKALGNVDQGFVVERAKARQDLPEFDQLRDQARDIKNHTLEYLDLYLEEYERKVIETGGHVHWTANANDACNVIEGICKKADVKTVIKSKSMVSEEMGINEVLEQNGIEPVETDLGEYIIQLRGERPSHIIAPAIHLTKGQIEANFRDSHLELPKDRQLLNPDQIVAEARNMLREQFVASDVGITGANFLIAETGTSVIVTNEGNGDLTQTLPRVHIVIASIEKAVPTLEDASTIIRLLARSATGQEITSYTTFSTGPRRPGDPDGPEEYHVVLLDNGRSEMLGSKFRDMLRCIRCGACMNHCPVYNAVGGHAYGWVYPGPMGAVLTPSLVGIDKAGHLPNASTFCGRCEAVCPMRIPLSNMMRYWREREFEQGNVPALQRFALRLWAWFAKHHRFYHWAAGVAMPIMAFVGRSRGSFHGVPLANGWTRHRDLPAPQGHTFQQLWRKGHKRGGRL